MSRPLVRLTSALVFCVVVATLAHAAGPAAPSPGKPGGVLNLLQREETTTGFAIHETATIATVWPASPCFSNLVVFDPFKPRETAESIVGELAERWSWQDGYRNLVFFLRRDVRWHDGQPFSSKDVKYTFDLVREAPEQPARLRLNPRKDWYANVEAIEAPDPTTVVFRLKKPQPSILIMLASGQSPVYPPTSRPPRCAAAASAPGRSSSRSGGAAS
jgi:peptide/nickel transport system substrate-binding protein